MGEAITSSPIGEAWSKTKPSSALRRERSKAFAPASASSSQVVNSSSTPTGALPCASRRAVPRIVATAALLSAPRIASWRFRSTPFSCTTSTGAASGTVSRWAQSRIVGAASGASMRASRLPHSEPVSAALSSSSTSSPSASSSARTAFAIAPSRLDGLSISHRRMKSASSRSRSAGPALAAARVIATRRAGERGAAPAWPCRRGPGRSRSRPGARRRPHGRWGRRTGRGRSGRR